MSEFLPGPVMPAVTRLFGEEMGSDEDKMDGMGKVKASQRYH